MTDADLARWEAQEQRWHERALLDSSLPVDVTLALLAEVRRLRAALEQVRERVERGRADWLALGPDHGVTDSPLLALIAEALTPTT